VTELDENLLPQQTGGADLPDWAYLPEGKPEEFGFPAGSHNQQKIQMWNRQEAFLAAYRRCGKIGRAARAAGLSRWAVDYWMKKDIFEFHKRIKAAHEDYCEDVIEQDIDDTLEDRKFNHDILRIFRAKAEKPGKYREDAKVVVNDSSQQLLDKLTVMAAKELEERRRLEAGAAEGEYRDLGETGRSA
jgi:hypothetical protein